MNKKKIWMCFWQITKSVNFHTFFKIIVDDHKQPQVVGTYHQFALVVLINYMFCYQQYHSWDTHHLFSGCPKQATKKLGLVVVYLAVACNRQQRNLAQSFVYLVAACNRQQSNLAQSFIQWLPVIGNKEAWLSHLFIQ